MEPQGAAPGSAFMTIRVFVPAVPEFAALVQAASRRPSCKGSAPLPEYQGIESSEPLEFGRKELGLKPAGLDRLFSGGLPGSHQIFHSHPGAILPPGRQ